VISRLRGTLLARELDRVELMTPGGVGYEVAIPRSVYERLPRVGEEVELRTYQLVREDAVLLFGFLEDFERLVFARLLTASGVGPKLALGLLSSLPAGRLVRAIRERDLAALTAISGVGRKTAERIAVDLASKLDDIAVPAEPGLADTPGIEDARRALAVLGYAAPEAERAIRAALREEGPLEAQELVRASLQRMK
jgi:holliday junction DNA helicase RuvA